MQIKDSISILNQKFIPQKETNTIATRLFHNGLPP